MEVRTGVAHILYVMSRIKTIENIGQALRMPGLDALLSAVVEEIGQPLVQKACYHSCIVTLWVTESNLPYALQLLLVG